MNSLKKILYAEDEADIRVIVDVAISTTSPFEIKFAENGKLLLDEVEGYKPDLIILDVKMPEMDGPTTLTELRKNPKTRNIPVIFMTAKPKAAEIAKNTETGVLGTILKPFDPLLLSNKIMELWNQNG